jgi:hypothetical protein
MVAPGEQERQRDGNHQRRVTAAALVRRGIQRRPFPVSGGLSFDSSSPTSTPASTLLEGRALLSRPDNLLARVPEPP